MGAWPPGARTTAVDPADQQLRGVEVEDVALPGGDPGITLCGVALRRRRESVANDTSLSVRSKQRDPSTVVVYFQGGTDLTQVIRREAHPRFTLRAGNMGSCVSRLPLFAHLLSSPLSPLSSGQTLILAVCPRSYYLSTNVRPTQAGLTRDYMAVLAHAQRAHPASRIVVYGHSLGGTAACCLLGSIPDQDRSILGDPECTGAEPLELLKPPDALILENPFPSVPLMIERSLYRSRCLPYHFLSPFVLDVWDASAALGQARGSLLGRTPVLFISGEDDSLVLPELVREMYEVAVRSDANAGLPADESSQIAGASDRPTTNGAVGSLRRWLSIPNAHHDNTWTLARPWGQGVRSFLAEVEAVSRKEADTPRDVGRGGDA
jgi:pimeloyl-ACP methyl ester carboxylesterase